MMDLLRQYFVLRTSDPDVKRKQPELHRIVYVLDGVIKDLYNDEVIPEDHIGYQKTPEDGVYELSAGTCGGGSKGGCKIGKPQQKCVTDGMYSKKKCAVWFPDNKFALTERMIIDYIKSMHHQREVEHDEKARKNQLKLIQIDL